MPQTTTNELLINLIGRDLMYRELFNADGSPSSYLQYFDTDINPDEYKVLGLTWSSAKQTLEKLAPYPPNTREYAGLPQQEQGSLKPKADSTDPAERYAAQNGNNIIVLPFSIDIDKNEIKIEFVRDFCPPYGGTSSERIVYLPLKD